MSEQVFVDDRYTSGIWYDMHYGDFSKIRRDDENKEVVFLFPHSTEVIDRIDAEEFRPGDMYRVPDKAIEDPVGVYKETISHLFDQGTTTESLGRLPFKDEVAFRYAREQVTVVEKRNL